MTTIAEGLRLIASHGGVVEARLLHTPKGTVSGYFNDLASLAQALQPWDGKVNLYITANPVRPDLLARANNRLKQFARATTADDDILRRAWFLLDADPQRPAGISATTQELGAALARRSDIVGFCRDLDFPRPFLGMSGNGGHAGWAVDLPNDEPTKLLFENALNALHTRFSDNVVTVDQAVFNAARIWKVYGSLAVKGDATVERPHRRASLDDVPDPLILLPREVMEALAAMVPPVHRTVSAPGARGPLAPLDLIAAFRERGWYKRPLARGKHAVVCPWANEHSGDSGVTESVLFEPQAPGGPWGYQCMHAHCATRTIRDVLAVLNLITGRAGDAEVDDLTIEDTTTPDPASVPYAFATPFPAEHFVTEFLAYARTCTDAAHEYHEAVALVLLASVARGLRAKFGAYPYGLRPNLYVLLLGDSTHSRKSTAKDIGLDILTRAAPDSIGPDAASPEGFIEQLAERSGKTLTTFIDEFGDLLDKLHHTKYMAGFTELLLKVYDGREHRYTRHSKRLRDGTREPDEDHVRDPHLSLLAATTPALFEEGGLTEKDVRKGLLPRFAIVMPTRKPARLGFHELQAPDDAARNALVRRLHDLTAWAAERAQPVRFDPPTLPALDAFVADLERRAARLDPGMRAMLQRLGAMVIKLAMLSALGRRDGPTPDGLRVTSADVPPALTVAARWRDDALAFAARIGESIHERHVQRCVRLLDGRPRLARRAVSRHLHLDKRALDGIEATLVDRGIITVRRLVKRGQPTLTLWVRQP